MTETDHHDAPHAEAHYHGEKGKMMFVVIEHMPDSDEPAEFENYADAVAYANELCDELEKAGYSVDRSWASSGNYFAAFAPDLGRYVAVERVDV